MRAKSPRSLGHPKLPEKQYFAKPGKAASHGIDG